MTDAEKEAQRQSWVRGELAIGNDRAEAAFRASMHPAEQYRAQRRSQTLFCSVLLFPLVYLAAVLLFTSGCAHRSAEEGIGDARRGLAGVGAAYTTLSVLYDTAVRARVEMCKRQVPEPADEEARRACMGPLASDGRIAADMERIKSIYDESADALAELELLVGSLTRALKEAGAPP